MQLGQAQQSRAHILVIDNDAEFRAFMHLLLSSDGFDGMFVSLAEAHVWSTDVRPDVVLCDPFGPSGLDVRLLERLTTAPTTRDVPVILCTGAVHLVGEARARLGHREVAVLPKPFDLDDLIGSIERVRAASAVG